jgi:AraC-like DNA-binding protein
MHDSDEIRQLLAAAEPRESHHQIGARYGLSPGAWSGEIRHSLWVADWVDADGMQTRVVGHDGGRPFVRRPGAWHVYAAGTRYRESYRAPDRIREDLWIFFELKAPLPPLSPRPFSVLLDPEGRLAGYVRTMHAHQRHAQPWGQAARRAAFATGLAEMLIATRHGGEGTPVSPWTLRAAHAAARDPLVARVDAVVSARLDSPPSLAELAERLSMSVSSLSHRFRAETGGTVMQRARWLRIARARDLLGVGHGVKDVSRRLGFPSATYFASAFRRATGVSPSEWQAQQRLRC